ncbi:MAG: hypothetical protein MJ147_06185 [Clostridia bacterium]|nr:hypothetical protein [Clostridia bacterium]
MKKIGTYFVIGLIVAFVGVLFSDIFADIFNGLPYGTGAILGICAYLCVVVITCTGIIISKIEEKSDKEKK